MNKSLPLVLFILSIALLVPGLTQPLMSIEAVVDKQDMLELTAEALTPANDNSQIFHSMLQSFVSQLKVEGSVTVFKSTRSLLGTMSELIANGHVLVGCLIGLFGVLIPLFKIVLASLSLLVKQTTHQQALLKLNGALSKWSMSDVFVMALMVTFLAINANEYAINTVQMRATLGSGFYFFAAYCILAIAAAQLMAQRVK